MSAAELSIRVTLLLAVCLGAIGLALRARLGRRRIEPPAGATSPETLDAEATATAVPPAGAQRRDGDP